MTSHSELEHDRSFLSSSVGSARSASVNSTEVVLPLNDDDDDYEDDDDSIFPRRHNETTDSTKTSSTRGLTLGSGGVARQRKGRNRRSRTTTNPVSLSEYPLPHLPILSTASASVANSRVVSFVAPTNLSPIISSALLNSPTNPNIQHASSSASITSTLSHQLDYVQPSSRSQPTASMIPHSSAVSINFGSPTVTANNNSTRPPSISSTSTSLQNYTLRSTNTASNSVAQSPYWHQQRSGGGAAGASPSRTTATAGGASGVVPAGGGGTSTRGGGGGGADNASIRGIPPATIVERAERERDREREAQDREDRWRIAGPASASQTDVFSVASVRTALSFGEKSVYTTATAGAVAAAAVAAAAAAAAAAGPAAGGAHGSGGDARSIWSVTSVGST
ncbi:hypothetical protein HDU84_000417 [Entophlyctis sp. JEL0112]|nr:hypothetical protein HDU84_000417 [Entophlyctis sp. JEL0112]